MQVKTERHGIFPSATAGLNVSKPFALGQLSERQTKQLVEPGKAAGFPVTVVAEDAFVELVEWQLIDDLGEDEASGIHLRLLPAWAARALQGSKTQFPIQIGKSNISCKRLIPMTLRDDVSQ